MGTNESVNWLQFNCDFLFRPYESQKHLVASPLYSHSYFTGYWVRFDLFFGTIVRNGEDWSTRKPFRGLFTCDFEEKMSLTVEVCLLFLLFIFSFDKWIRHFDESAKIRWTEVKRSEFVGPSYIYVQNLITPTFKVNLSNKHMCTHKFMTITQ